MTDLETGSEKGHNDGEYRGSYHRASYGMRREGHHSTSSLRPVNTSGSRKGKTSGSRKGNTSASRKGNTSGSRNSTTSGSRRGNTSGSRRGGKTGEGSEKLSSFAQRRPRDEKGRFLPNR